VNGVAAGITNTKARMKSDLSAAMKLT
jgi:NAD(P)-dependent dehydrogenase (short-subunit alcohol dehydrogenase family)